jgi:tRNA threonylcarbamoyladenosine modification (KEOPS) complex  Pcc1 subunit
MHSIQLVSAKLKFTLETKDRRLIHSLREAIAPEVGKIGRCIVSFDSEGKRKDSGLNLSFESKDLISLRASFNTNLRLLSSAIRTINAVSIRRADLETIENFERQKH